MTKSELEKWIQQNPKDGWDKTVIDGDYEFIEVDGEWKLIVEGNINLIEMGLTELPNIFHLVSGMFDCSENQITSLKHCPDTVKKLDCSGNQLTSLEYCPCSVETLYCIYNQLKGLEHCPNSVKYLNCFYNQLTNLKYAPLNLEKFISDFSDEEYENYVTEAKDKLEREASSERVDEIEQLMELSR